MAYWIAPVKFETDAEREKRLKKEDEMRKLSYEIEKTPAYGTMMFVVIVIVTVITIAIMKCI